MTLIRLTGDDDEEYETAGVCLESESGVCAVGLAVERETDSRQTAAYFKVYEKNRKKKFIKEI